MNRIYKVIYSKARQCAMVVSELAKSSHKKSQKEAGHASTPALARIIAAALAVGALTWGSAFSVSQAADVNGIVKTDDGSLKSVNAALTYDGSNTNGQIALGNNATVFIGKGGQEGIISPTGQAKDAAGGIAIGSNTYARTGSIMIGSHSYKGNMGDVQNIDTSKIDTSETGAYGHTVASTTIGTNSFTKGFLATTVGDYNIQSGRTEGWGLSSMAYGAQNFGATVLGTLNSNESATAPKPFYSGIANSIVGTANKVNNSNGTLVFGAGNTVKNSITDITGVSDTTNLKDANTAADTLRKAIKGSKSGGATLVIGGGNEAENTLKTQIIGVNNRVTGTEETPSDYNMVNAFGTDVTNSSHLYTIGDNNHITDTTKTIVFGDNRYVSNTHDSIIIGSLDESKGPQYTTATDATIIGHNANAWGQEGIAFGKDTGAGQNAIAIGSKANAWKAHSTAIGNSAVGGAEYGVAIGEGATVTNRYKDNGKGEYVEDTEHPATDAVAIGHNALTNVKGGVALGAGSIASVDYGAKGYDFLTKAVSTSDDKAWKSSWAAVSIGDSTHTRQITNLAAGFNDTDAVNVAQLKAVAEKIGPAMNFVAGDGISIVKKDGVYTISANIKGGSTPTDVVTVEPEKSDEGGNTSGSTADTLVTPPVKPGNSGNTENPGSTDNPSNGKKLVIKTDTNPTTFAADTGAAAVKPGETLKINGDKNIMTTASDHGIAISLNKDITVDSVTAGVVTINKDNKGTIGGLTNKTWNSTKITSGQAATEDQLQAATKNAVNYDGDTSKTITLREDTTIRNVADTTIEDGAKNAVNAGTVYNETRVKQDGTYVKVSNTAGENLSALDNQVTSNTQNINYLNGRVGELGDRINKVGAGAAALAALHPLDYDPEDKWDFAAGVGNYRNATAAAVGLFYRPNERTMFNLGWTMGDNRNMVNGGFSLKFGKSNKYIKYSKAEMASVIDKQSREIAELKARDVQNAKDKAEMKADNAEMKAEIEALKKQVEALAAKK